MPRRGEQRSLSEVEGLILEIGCGTGRNLPGFLKSGHRVHAVDFDFDAVSTAKMLMTEEGVANQISFSVARAENLPFIHNVFSEVHCIEVLHWASNTRQFEMMWMEAWRVLQPGGIFSTTLRPADSWAEADDKASWFIADDVLIDALIEQCHAIRVDPSTDSASSPQASHRNRRSSLVLRKKNNVM